MYKNLYKPYITLYGQKYPKHLNKHVSYYKFIIRRINPYKNKSLIKFLFNNKLINKISSFCVGITMSKLTAYILIILVIGQILFLTIITTTRTDQVKSNNEKDNVPITNNTQEKLFTYNKNDDLPNILLIID